MKLPAWLHGAAAHDAELLPGLSQFIRLILLAIGLAAATLATMTLSCHDRSVDAELQEREALAQIRTQNEATVRRGVARRDADNAQLRAKEARADTATARLRVVAAAADRAIARIHVAPDPSPAAAPELAGDTARRVTVMRDGDSTRYAAPAFLVAAMQLLEAKADTAMAALEAEHAARRQADSVIAHDTQLLAAQDTLVGTLKHEVSLRDTIIAKARPSRCGRRCGVVLGILGTLATGFAVRQAAHALAP